MKNLDLRKLSGCLAENKYVFLVLALGLVLLLLPRSGGDAANTAVVPSATGPPGGAGDPLEASGIPLDTEAERLAALLRAMTGVGDATVLLSREGAVVVCAGADSAKVRLEVTNAVAAYTGLGSGHIIVMKMTGG